MKVVYRLSIYLPLISCLFSCGPDVKDDPYSPCQSELDAPPSEIPPRLKFYMSGLMNNSYWLLTNPQGDTLTITADSTYTINTIPNPECAGCEDCPDMFELTKENFRMVYQRLNFNGFRDSVQGPFSFKILMKDAESPAEIRVWGADDMLWDIVEDEVTDSDEIPEIWHFLPSKKFNGKSYSQVYFRDPAGKVNFDRGYVWYMSAEIGPIALHDYRGLNINPAHDTLTLKTYH